MLCAYRAGHCQQTMLQCVAACCTALQCVAVCCSILQCVVACCSLLQYVALCCDVLQRAAACCSILQCAAVCCSVLQCTAVCVPEFRGSLAERDLPSYRIFWVFFTISLHHVCTTFCLFFLFRFHHLCTHISPPLFFCFYIILPFGLWSPLYLLGLCTHISRPSSVPPCMDIICTPTNESNLAHRFFFFGTDSVLSTGTRGSIDDDQVCVCAREGVRKSVGGGMCV